MRQPRPNIPILSAVVRDSFSMHNRKSKHYSLSLVQQFDEAGASIWLLFTIRIISSEKDTRQAKEVSERERQVDRFSSFCVVLCESATFVFWSPIYFFLNIYKLFFFRSFAGCCVWLWASLSLARRKKKIEIDKQDQRLQENNIIIYLLFRTKRLLQTMSSCFLIMALTTVSVNYTKFPFGCAFRSERDIFFFIIVVSKNVFTFFPQRHEIAFQFVCMPCAHNSLICFPKILLVQVLPAETNKPNKG